LLQKTFINYNFFSHSQLDPGQGKSIAFIQMCHYIRQVQKKKAIYMITSEWLQERFLKLTLREIESINVLIHEKLFSYFGLEKSI
jgi:hypothetical protein